MAGSIDLRIIAIGTAALVIVAQRAPNADQHQPRPEMRAGALLLR